MTKKQGIGTVAFLLIAVLIIIVMSDLFESENTSNRDMRFYTYRHLPKDTIDAVFIGTSGVDRYWMAPKAYEEYGMTVYPLCTDSMPSWLYTNVIEEAYAHQNPQLLLIDIRAFTRVDESIEKADVRARRVLDSGFRLFSWNQIKAGYKTMKWIQSIDETAPKFDISYFLPFVKYHTKWKEGDFSIGKNLGGRDHKYGGFMMSSTLSVKTFELEANKFNFEVREDLDPLCERELHNVIDYVKEKNVKVLFVDTPQYMDEEQIGRVNRVYDILEEEGMDYVHFYSDKTENGFTIDLDAKKDFFDDIGHVNYYGSEKFMDAFAAYLDENYDLPDRRNDEDVKEYWDGKYDAIKKKIKKYEKKQANKEK